LDATTPDGRVVCEDEDILFDVNGIEQEDDDDDKHDDDDDKYDDDDDKYDDDDDEKSDDFPSYATAPTLASSSPGVHGLTPGSTNGFFVVQTYETNVSATSSGFDVENIKATLGLDERDVARLDLTSNNVSVVVALMMSDPKEYPTMTRARKACRKANVLIHRGPLLPSLNNTGKKGTFDPKRCLRARVGDRVYPGDVIAKQTRIGDGSFPVMNHRKPPYDLPVIFEDDHFAIGTSRRNGGRATFCCCFLVSHTIPCSQSLVRYLSLPPSLSPRRWAQPPLLCRQ
jgi:hypothetical protein